MTAKWVRTTSNSRVFVRHEKGCDFYAGKRCRCNPSYRGEVWNSDLRRPEKQSPVVPNANEAAGWVTAKLTGTAIPMTQPAAGVSAEEFVASFFKAARAGNALAKGGKEYVDATVDHYERDWKHHVRAHVIGKPINAMDAPAWQAVVENAKAIGQRDAKGKPNGKPLAAGTLRVIFAGVRAAYRWGHHPARRIVATNPWRDVQIAKGPKAKVKRVAAPETIPGLLAALKGRCSKRGPAPDPAVPIVWAVMFYAGLRISEAVALDWPEVDLKTGWIRVLASKSETGTGRSVPIVPELAAILRAWQADNHGQRIGSVFHGISAKTVDSNARRRWPKRGLDVFAPHEARHTFASVMVANRDVSLADLQEWLGHASLQTTALYVKTLPGFRSESVHARIAGTFGGA